ncbi:MAG: hypothetical protein Q8S15_05935 [Erysipelotrichaceae bacterium]|nr:hypothetical protein [Erysipelotrichaceae bacterium]MDP3305588.1 hypothetical protein [Erysipelotrichaceae bacterium]
MNSKEQILQMVKEGTITVEDGIKLLEALGTQGAQTHSVQPVINVNPAGGRKMLRVTVDSAKGDVVRINVPTSLVKAGLNLSNQLKIDGNPVDMKGVDVDMIMAAIEEGATGEIVNVESAEGDVVKIFID